MTPELRRCLPVYLAHYLNAVDYAATVDPRNDDLVYYAGADILATRKALDTALNEAAGFVEVEPPR